MGYSFTFFLLLGLFSVSLFVMTVHKVTFVHRAAGHNDTFFFFFIFNALTIWNTLVHQDGKVGMLVLHV